MGYIGRTGPAIGSAVARRHPDRTSSRSAADRSIEEGEEVVEVERLREDRGVQPF